MLVTRSKVAREIKMETSVIREYCANINKELKGMVRRSVPVPSDYITEKASKIAWRAERIERLNKLMSTV